MLVGGFTRNLDYWFVVLGFGKLCFRVLNRVVVIVVKC